MKSDHNKRRRAEAKIEIDPVGKENEIRLYSIHSTQKTP